MSRLTDEGPLGAGWPDLTLLRVRDRRLLHETLAAAGQPVNVWRPADFDAIAEALR